MDGLFSSLFTHGALFVVGVVLGYAVGWNRAKHPDKVDGWFDRLK